MTMPRLHITIQPADDGNMANGEIVSIVGEANEHDLWVWKRDLISDAQKSAKRLGITLGQEAKT